MKFVAPLVQSGVTYNLEKLSDAGGQLKNGLGFNLSLSQIPWGSNLKSEMETSIWFTEAKQQALVLVQSWHSVIGSHYDNYDYWVQLLYISGGLKWSKHGPQSKKSHRLRTSRMWCGAFKGIVNNLAPNLPLAFLPSKYMLANWCSWASHLHHKCEDFCGLYFLLQRSSLLSLLPLWYFTPKESAGVLEDPPCITLEAWGGQKMLQEVREKSEPSGAKG